MRDSKINFVSLYHSSNLLMVTVIRAFDHCCLGQYGKDVADSGEPERVNRIGPTYPDLSQRGQNSHGRSDEESPSRKTHFPGRYISHSSKGTGGLLIIYLILG